MKPSLSPLTLWPVVWLTLALGACGSPPASKAPQNLPLVDTATSPPIERVDVAVTELKRADVVRVVDQGFGKFLQDAELEVQYSEGRYVGYRLVRIHNAERYRGAGLEPGDVITQINGKSIEREEQAFEVFRSLRDAPFLEVSYLRQGEPMRLSLPIVGEPMASAPPAASVPPSAQGTPPSGTDASAPTGSPSTQSSSSPAAPDSKIPEAAAKSKKAKK